jgi:hypothetical protein
VATVERGSAAVVTAMAGDITHREFPPGATAATAATGKGTMHREAQLEAEFMVLVRDRKVEPLPSSLLVRQIIPVAITSREINPELDSRVSPASSPVIMQTQIGTFGSNALA